jgi:hypothetical protein
VLFGHLHRRSHTRLETTSGALEILGASGAALDHPDPAVRAGFNLYRLDDQGTLLGAEARVVTPDGAGLRSSALAGGGG